MNAQRTWTRSEIDALINRSDAAVEKGIITLFNLQTNDEQRVADTRRDNDRGFNCFNARVGTRFARWLLGMDDHNVVKYPAKSLNHELAARVFKKYTKGDTVINRARKICLIHSQQLTDVANGVLEVAK